MFQTKEAAYAESLWMRNQVPLFRPTVLSQPADPLPLHVTLHHMALLHLLLVHITVWLPFTFTCLLIKNVFVPSPHNDVLWEGGPLCLFIAALLVPKTAPGNGRGSRRACWMNLFSLPDSGRTDCLFLPSSAPPLRSSSVALATGGSLWS